MGLHIDIKGIVQGSIERQSKVNKAFFVVDFAQTEPRIGQENLFADVRPATGPAIAHCEYSGGNLRVLSIEALPGGHK